MDPPGPFVTWTPGKIWHNDTYDAINPNRPELSAKGKKIVVTGGGYGIGKEIVRSFATAGAATISILGRKQGPLEQTKAEVGKAFAGTKVDYYIADVTNQAQLKAAADKIGQWDVLVMNAGYLQTPTPVATADAKEWWLGFEINVLGSFLTTQTFLPTRNEGSTIVAFSTAGIVFPASMAASFSGYMTSKLAVNKFMEIFAAEHPDVHAVTIHPGVIQTDMLTKSGLGGAMPSDNIALPANFVVWIASPEAQFLRGKFVWCNWDVDELKAQADKIKGTSRFDLSLSGYPLNA